MSIGSDVGLLFAVLLTRDAWKQPHVTRELHVGARLERSDRVKARRGLVITRSNGVAAVVGRISNGKVGDYAS